MAIFTKEQNAEARAKFINECRVNAWSAAVHADWSSKITDNTFKQVEALDAEEKHIKDEIEKIKAEPEYHKVENRNKVKELSKAIPAIHVKRSSYMKMLEDAHNRIKNLYQTIEVNLKLAEHAETFEWKENENTKVEEKPVEVSK
jgi:hypothetical protein